MPEVARCFRSLHNQSNSHLRLIEVDGDFQVGRAVVDSVGDVCPGRGLQLRGETGLQPLVKRQLLDSLHLLLADAKHLTAEVLHLLVVDAVQLVETWRREREGGG